MLAHTVCAALRRRLPGYATTTPDILQRRFLQTSGEILNRGDELIVRLNRRAYSPVLRQPTSPPSPSPGGATEDSATSSPERYGWAVAREKAFGPGAHPVPICHEWNTIAHLNDDERKTEACPLSSAELQQFLDYADDQIDRAVRSKRKGALAAYRDATMLKVIEGWGLRRAETSKLDLLDWGRNRAAPEFGGYGMLHVR